jgi:hypothetical protein
MIPKKQGKKKVLVCRVCGYTKKYTKKAEIKVSGKTESQKILGIPVVLEEKKKTDEEKVLLEDLYKESLEYFETS